MEELPTEVELTKVADGKVVTGNFVKLTRSLAQKEIDGKWWQLPGVSKSDRRNENDHDWKWAERLGQLRQNRWHEAVAIQTSDSRVQGAMLYFIDTRSFEDEDEGALYIEALATAPRNRPSLVQNPKFRGVGDSLLIRAVLHSYLLGLEGRVNFHVFEDEALAAFYEKRGFVAVGEDDEGPQYELRPDTAIALLNSRGYER